MIDKTNVALGRISNASFGWGGHQDAMIGLTVGLAGQSWAVGDFWGVFPDGEDEISVDKVSGATLRRLAELLAKAKVKSVDKLVGIPVEITFDGQVLKSWRVLTEVL
jgi:hypothetical protein